jgi:hypothetical protein
VQGGAFQWVQTPPGNRSSQNQSEQRLGSRMVTYADDLVILCKKGKTDEALQQLRKIMSKLKLTVNEEKTRIWKEGEFDFLGHAFGRMYSAITVRCAWDTGHRRRASSAWLSKSRH